MLTTFSFGVSSNLSQQKNPTAKIIVLRKYMPIISAVGLFCCDKFEETPNEKVVNMSKLTKPYFSKESFTRNIRKYGFNKNLANVVRRIWEPIYSIFMQLIKLEGQNMG